MVKSTCKTSNGFSLIELVLTLSLFVIILSLGLVVSLDAYRAESFRDQRDLLIALLQKTRSQAMNNINQSAHGLYINTGLKTYTAFEGANYLSRDPSLDEVFTYGENLEISGMTEIIFTQLRGQSLFAGSIILDDHIRPAAQIDINSEGGINSN